MISSGSVAVASLECPSPARRRWLCSSMRAGVIQNSRKSSAVPCSSGCGLCSAAGPRPRCAPPRYASPRQTRLVSCSPSVARPGSKERRHERWFSRASYHSYVGCRRSPSSGDSKDSDTTMVGQVMRANGCSDADAADAYRRWRRTLPVGLAVRSRISGGGMAHASMARGHLSGHERGR
jgi:hypothetical protein